MSAPRAGRFGPLAPLIGFFLAALAVLSLPGHAFMQYDATNAYRVGDRVVVRQPFSAPQQFRYRKGRLVPAALDPELARDVDSIVMATAGRTGLAHMVIGSVAEKVVRHAPVPVLTVRAVPGAGKRTVRPRGKRRQAA